MTATGGTAPHREPTIGPSRGPAWFVVLGQSAVTATATYFSGGGTVTGILTVSTLLLVLLWWHRDLAPRLAFNASGMVLRTGWELERFRWDEVEYTWLVSPPAHRSMLCLQVGGGRRMFVEYPSRSVPALLRFQQVRQSYRPEAAGSLPSLPRFLPLAAPLACWATGLVVQRALVP